MESKTLVEWLRKIHEDNDEDGITIFSEAADRIELLERQLAKCKEQRDEYRVVADWGYEPGNPNIADDAELKALAEVKP